MQSIQSDLINIQALIQKAAIKEALSNINVLFESATINNDLNQKSSLLYSKSVCLRLLHEHNSAISCLDELIKINPEAARYHQEQAYNHRANGDLKRAAIGFYKATRLNPALLSAWQALLPIYHQQGQVDAERIAAKQIKELSALPKPLLAAKDLLYDGNVDAADKLCRQYLQANKHSIDGLLLLAELATQLKVISEAEFILETCVELSPNNPECLYPLFKIYNKLGKFDKALKTAESLLTISPNNVFYMTAKATSMVGVGQINEAIDAYEALTIRHHNKATLMILLGHAYKAQGDIQKAVAAYKQAYRAEFDCADAYWSLANTKTYNFDDLEISQMTALLGHPDVSLDNKVHAEFALGKAYEDRKMFAQSFAHYESGNAIKRQQTRYSSTKQHQFVDHQITTFSKEFSEKLAEQGHPDPAPIFIVGLPRAGSTLLEQILASHSMVDGTMELHEILSLAAQLSRSKDPNHSYPGNIASLPKGALRDLGERFISNTQVYRQQAAFFIDKMPNNFLHIGLIKAILPNAKIIDARRDPMACCFSGFKQLFGEGQEFSYSLRDMALYYQYYVKLMDHWQQIYPNQILLVQHEDVVNNTEQAVVRMLEYCGLPFEQSCLDFHKNKRAVKTPSSEQVRQPIYKTALHQWKHYEPYLGELTKRFR